MKATAPKATRTITAIELGSGTAPLLDPSPGDGKSACQSKKVVPVDKTIGIGVTVSFGCVAVELIEATLPNQEVCPR